MSDTKHNNRIVLFQSDISFNPSLVSLFKKISDLGVHVSVVSFKATQHINEYFEYVLYTELTEEMMEDSILFTCLPDLFFALSCVGKQSNCKICIYVDGEESFVRFLKVSKLVHFNASSLLSLLSQNNDSLLFLDSSSCAALCDAGAEMEVEGRFVPYLLSQKVPEFRPRNTINEDEINIGWVGPIFGETQIFLSHVCNDLMKDASGRKITLHLIGPGSDSVNMQMMPYSPRIRFAFLGKMADNTKRLEYVRNNVDFIIAYQNQALDSAIFGVPVYISPIYGKYVGKFGLLSDVEGYSYSDRYDLRSKRTVSITEILSEIYRYGRKTILAERCFSYAMDNLVDNLWSEKILISIRAASLCPSDFNNERFVKDSVRQIKKNTNKVKNDFDLIIETIIRSNERTVSNMVDANIAHQPKAYTIHRGRYYVNRMQYRAKCTCRVLVSGMGRIISWGKGIVWKCGVFAYKKVKYTRVQRAYPAKVKHIIQKCDGKKIKVAFIILFKTSFPMRRVFEKMIDHPDFDPYIIVSFNKSRSHHYGMALFNDAYTCLSNDYPGRVIAGYDEKKDQYLDLGDEYPIIVFCNPYKQMVDYKHDIEYFLDKDVLGIYMNYGYAAVAFWKEVISTDFYSEMWKVCVENETNFKYLKKVQVIHGKNGVVTGYAKMDKLADVVKLQKERKRILICPHHTVWGWSVLNISNFLTYYGLFLKLPKMFPDVDFIFRPHPLLFPNLRDHKIWTEEQIERYQDELLSNPNMTYSTCEDYSDEFIQSDAMIHDCASFTAEYLFTNNPCCYMIKSKKETYDTMLPFGKECLSNYYHASNEQDIIDFIQDVVINGNDPLKEKRTEFVETKLRVNYPHASEYFIDYLKKELDR